MLYLNLAKKYILRSFAFDLTLTSVVFEFNQPIRQRFDVQYLTLTSVVFEFEIENITVDCTKPDLTLTSVVFESCSQTITKLGFKI